MLKEECHAVRPHANCVMCGGLQIDIIRTLHWIFKKRLLVFHSIKVFTHILTIKVVSFIVCLRVFFLSWSTVVCNNLIVTIFRMIEMSLFYLQHWSIYSNETLQVIHLGIVLHFPKGLILFLYCLQHTAACECSGS